MAWPPRRSPGEELGRGGWAGVRILGARQCLARFRGACANHVLVRERPECGGFENRPRQHTGSAGSGLQRAGERRAEHFHCSRLRAELERSPVPQCERTHRSAVRVVRVSRRLVATYFNWKKKYSGMMPSEMKRLRELEQENARLKKIVADLTLDKEMLQDVIKRKL